MVLFSLGGGVSWLFVYLCLQVFLQDLSRGQATVASFNELSNQLLQEYSTDDTRRIKEVTDKHNGAWNSINNRWDTHTHTWLQTHTCRRMHTDTVHKHTFMHTNSIW